MKRIDETIKSGNKMRPLRRYIYEIENQSTLKRRIFEEDEESVTVSDLTVTYNGPEKLYVQVPKTYSESDIQLYLDDMLLPQLPAGKDLSEKFFGMNANNISDVYFEYDNISEALGEDQDIDIEWNARYDSNTGKDDEFTIMCIDNIRYIILFDEFTLINIDKNDIKYELINLFNTTNSSNINEYPFELIFDNKNIEFKE